MKKRKPKMKLDLILPNTNEVDGKITHFIRKLDTDLNNRISINLITPTLSSEIKTILFSCEIDTENFEDFQNIYKQIFSRDFSFTWES